MRTLRSRYQSPFPMNHPPQDELIFPSERDRSRISCPWSDEIFHETSNIISLSETGICSPNIKTHSWKHIILSHRVLVLRPSGVIISWEWVSASQLCILPSLHHLQFSKVSGNREVTLTGSKGTLFLRGIFTYILGFFYKYNDIYV